MNIETKISNFFDEILKENEVDRVLNQTFLTLSEKVGVGLDAMIRSLHNQCILDEGFESGWESTDGKHHLAVICVKNDDNQEHCFGEWLEKSQGVIVLEPNRDNEDAITKSIAYLHSQGYEILHHQHSRDARLYSAVKFLQQEDYACINLKSEDNGWQHAKDIVQTLGGIVYRSTEAEIEDMKDCGYIVIKDGDKNSTSIIDVVNYLQSHNYEPFINHLEASGYISIHSDNVNNFCIEHLTKENYFVCDGNSDIESLVKLYKEEPNKFSNILQKTYRFRIDSLHEFNISCEVKSFSYQNAHIEMRQRLDKACHIINKSQDLIHLNADLIQIVSM